MSSISIYKNFSVLGLLTFAGLAVYCWLATLTVPDQLGLVRYVIVAVLLVLSIFFRHKGYLRGVYIYLALFAALQYWHWRITQTLSFTGIPDFTASMMLLMAEIYSALQFFLGLFMGVSPLKRKLRPPPKDQCPLPSVDVFIPTYNEPVELAKITALAACNMTYPEDRFTVHILDDGGTLEKRNSEDPDTRRKACSRHEELKKFCKEAGVRYHTREKNVHAKAGNLNHAFRKTTADVIAVLDCDHVPTKDFLRKTTHYFLKDPKLFLVQTPHFFINPDPLDRNLKMFYAAPSENEMFYKGILPEMDYWESAYFCGSAALLSRKCLETTDGFSGETVTEDAETSIELHSKGFRSMYLPSPLVCGITPDIFADFISQKVRWAQGMIQLFILKNVFRKKGLKWYQKLCYFNCIFYWFFSFSRLVFLIAPLFFLFFSLNVYNASLHQIMMYTVPYLMTLFITHGYLHGDVRWPLFSEIYEILLSIYLLPAIIGVLINPRKPTFKVTAKGDTLSKDKLSALAYPFHIIFLGLCFSMGLCIYKYIHEPFYRDTLLLTGCWILFNSSILFFALGVVYERKQIRKFHRAKAWRKVRIRTGAGEFQGRLTDLSWTGVGLEIDDPDTKMQELSAGHRLTVIYKDSDGEKFEIPLEIKYLRTNSTDREGERSVKITVGGEITLDDSIEATRKKALFVYGDSERWQRFWKMKTRRKSMIFVFLYLLKNASLWSVKGGMEFFKDNITLMKNFITRFLFHRAEKTAKNIIKTASLRQKAGTTNSKYSASTTSSSESPYSHMN